MIVIYYIIYKVSINGNGKGKSGEGQISKFSDKRFGRLLTCFPYRVFNIAILAMLTISKIIFYIKIHSHVSSEGNTMSNDIKKKRMNMKKVKGSRQ